MRILLVEDDALTGSGLGLSIVQQIVEQHQASIQIKPSRDGQGTKISVTFKP